MRVGIPVARWWYRFAGCVVVAAVCASCAQDGDSGAKHAGDANDIHVVSFSSAQSGWEAIAGEFHSSDGRDVNLEFGASSDLVKALKDGEPADVAHLGDADDMAELVRAEVIPAGWNNGTTGGSPVNSVVTMVVRKGNPRGISDWPDLLQPGLEVVTPNPVHVGSGRWALLAAYAAASHGNQDPDAGQDYVRRLILEHVALGPATVKQATDDFTNGRGDVLLVSEASALQMIRNGQAVEQVLPPQTLLMEFEIAVTNTGLGKPGATELVRFLFSPQGQQVWAESGMRPCAPVPGVEFPTPQSLWTVADLGGWDIIGNRFFGANGLITNLFEMATQ